MKTTFRHFRIDKETGELLPYFKPFTDKDGLRCTPGYSPSEKGGFTVCFIMDGDTPVAHGFSECSKKDAFKYSVGRKISFDRAIAMQDGKKVPYHTPRKSPVRNLLSEMQGILNILTEPSWL